MMCCMALRFASHSTRCSIFGFLVSVVIGGIPSVLVAQAAVRDRLLVENGVLETIVLEAILNDYVNNPTVSFQQTYATPPIVVCSGQSSGAKQAPIVRVNNVSTTGFSVRTQRLFKSNSSAVSGIAYCIVAKTGVNQWRDGTYYQVGSVSTSSTRYRNKWVVSRGKTVTLDPTLQGEVGVLAQILTDDSRYYERGQAEVVSRNTDTRFPPFDNGSRTFLLGRHTGKGTYTVGAETVGYIAFQTGVSTFVRPADGVPIFKAGGISNRVVQGVYNSPPYSDTIDPSDANVVQALRAAAVTQQGQRGNNGAFGILYGADPFTGNEIDVAVDEYGHSGTNRDHEALEYMAWWGFGEYPAKFVVNKSVNIDLTSDLDLLTYQITVENVGTQTVIPDTPVDVLSQSGAALAFTSDVTLVDATDTGSKGEFSPGEIWTYQASYQLSQDNFIDGGDIENSFTITGVVKNDLVGGQAIAIGSNLPSGTETRPTVITELDPEVDVSVVKEAYYANGTIIPDGVGVSVGESVTYVYTITNTGSLPLDNITISDDHRGSGPLVVQGCNLTKNQSNSLLQTGASVIERLGAEDVAECSSTYTVTQVDIDRQ